MTTVEKEYVHKSEKLADIGRDAGWDARILPEINGTSITWVIEFVRKPEAMKVTYVDNRLTDAVYVCGDKVTSPAHKAAVVKILLGHPDLTKLDGNSIAKQPRQLPFNPEDDAAGEILIALLGKKITWLNSLSTELESEYIDPARNKGSKFFRIIRTADGRRYVEFTTNQGFRAVYLDAIVSAH